jgi:hypothetical protein
MNFVPIIRMPNMVTAAWRRFAVHIFEGTFPLEDMARLDAAASAWHKKNPGKVVELVIIHPSNARMSSDERIRMAEMIKKWESARSASATVILASGLTGAMHRSILTGLQMLAPPPHPTKVFGATADAVGWLTPYVQGVCGVDAATPDLIAALDELTTFFRTMRTSESGRAASG